MSDNGSLCLLLPLKPVCPALDLCWFFSDHYWAGYRCGVSSARENQIWQLKIGKAVGPAFPQLHINCSNSDETEWDEPGQSVPQECVIWIPASLCPCGALILWRQAFNKVNTHEVGLKGTRPESELANALLFLSSRVGADKLLLHNFTIL